MIADRLVELLPAITRKAGYVASQTLAHDDIVQEMALAILERAAKRPGLENQKNAYILWDAYMNGGVHAARHERLCHEQHASSVMVECDTEDDDFSIGAVIPVDSQIMPEDALIQSEGIYNAMHNLNATNRQVLSMLYLGYSETEIAHTLHISRPAVSQRKRTIAKTLAATMF